jgi:PII-like signaling protein
MLTTGKAVKVTIYLSDGAKHKGMPVYTDVVQFLYDNGIAGATVCKGVAGFGKHHRMHAAHILDLSDHLPIKVEFIDSPEKVENIMPELKAKCGCGLIETQETNVIVPSRV